jgi:hypothetical protein
MLRLIIEISCSSSNTSSFLLSLWYRRFAASLVGVAPVFESFTLPRFCCVVVAPVFELLSPLGFVVFCCSSVRTPLFPSILLWWYPHVSILLLFPHSRRPIVSLVLSLVRRIRWSSILRRVGTDLSLLLFWGLEEINFLLHLAHLKNWGFWGFGKLFDATHQLMRILSLNLALPL